MMEIGFVRIENIFEKRKERRENVGYQLFHFLRHLSKTMPLRVQYGILKIMYRICAKPKEADPIKLISLQVSISIALKYDINNSV